jgi:hypothetical protein
MEDEGVVARPGGRGNPGADLKRFGRAPLVEERVSALDEVGIHALRLTVVTPDLIRGP